MIPVFCAVKHNPPETHGDCVRACIASLLELASEDVPHFADCNDGEKMLTDIRAWLEPRGYAPFIGHLDGDASLGDILEIQAINNPNCYYMLFGSVEGGGEHVVIYQGDRLAHDPAWYRVPLIGPNQNGTWIIMVLAKL